MNEPSTEFLTSTLLSGLSTDDPCMLPTSVGEGRKSITASNTLCTPLFLNADPHKVGTKALSRHLFSKHL